MPTLIGGSSGKINPVFQPDLLGPATLSVKPTVGLSANTLISVLDVEGDPLLRFYALLDLSGNGYGDPADAQSAIGQPSDSVVPSDYDDATNNAKIWELLYYLPLNGAGIVLSEGSSFTVAGQITARGLNVSQYVALSGVVTPTALTGNVNDYNPSGFSSSAFTLRLSGGAADRNITGLNASISGRLARLVNIGTTNSLILKEENASSLAANRFLLGGDITIGPNKSVVLFYDSTSARWRAL